jgi:hypothetical protein
MTVRLCAMCIDLVLEFYVEKLEIYFSRESYLCKLQMPVGRIKHSLYQS